MKVLKYILLVIGIIIVLIVLYLAYLGFIPGLSALFGANKPKDLGVKYNEQDFASYLGKAGTSEYTTMTEAKSPGESIIFSGKKDITTTFTNAEASARIGYSKWAYMPVTHPQVKLNSDGSFEFSANLILNRLDNFTQAIGGIKYSKADIEKGIGLIKITGASPPIYIKASPKVADNKVSVKIDNITVGRVKVPLEKADANGFFAQLTEQIFGRVTNFNAKSVTFGDNALNFSGTVPEKFQVLTNK